MVKIRKSLSATPIKVQTPKNSKKQKKEESATPTKIEMANATPSKKSKKKQTKEELSQSPKISPVKTPKSKKKNKTTIAKEVPVNSLNHLKLSGQKDSKLCLHVGNIPYNIPVEDLKKYFATMEPVTSCVARNGSGTRKNRGYAFVYFKTKEDLDDVLGQKHSMDGRDLTIKLSGPMQKGEQKPRKRKLEAGDANSSSSASKKSKLVDSPYEHEVHIGHLNLDTTEADLREAMEKYGKILNVIMPMMKWTDKMVNRGFAIVAFKTEKAFKKAMEATIVIDDKTLVLKRAKKQRYFVTQEETDASEEMETEATSDNGNADDEVEDDDDDDDE